MEATDSRTNTRPRVHQKASRGTPGTAGLVHRQQGSSSSVSSKSDHSDQSGRTCSFKNDVSSYNSKLTGVFDWQVTLNCCFFRHRRLVCPERTRTHCQTTRVLTRRICAAKLGIHTDWCGMPRGNSSGIGTRWPLPIYWTTCENDQWNWSFMPRSGGMPSDGTVCTQRNQPGRACDVPYFSL